MAPPALSPTLAFLYSVPTPPNTVISNIRGNTSDDEKLMAVKGFWHFASAEESFCIDIGQRIRMVELNIDDCIGQCIVVHEVEVTRDMCNYWGVLHGTCSAYIADACCASSLYILGARLGIDARGMTRSMELVWSNPAPLFYRGTLLQIISTAKIDENTRSSGCEMKDKKSGKMCATSTQSLGPMKRLVKLGCEIFWRFSPATYAFLD
ncbi:hypothetical protein B0H17DRAFT_1140843 [Mycena rosella]|uniref:Uncharacterized protein n=1 Tax=Mycena rosella TaxID=1033263 RepID=A0AAD7D0X0_MYCRO|nr:hypothetical protein B0H17DRAFT_1140843 [Mycena rosella]